MGDFVKILKNNGFAAFAALCMIAIAACMGINRGAGASQVPVGVVGLLLMAVGIFIIVAVVRANKKPKQAPPQPNPSHQPHTASSQPHRDNGSYRQQPPNQRPPQWNYNIPPYSKDPMQTVEETIDKVSHLVNKAQRMARNYNYKRPPSAGNSSSQQSGDQQKKQ